MKDGTSESFWFVFTWWLRMLNMSLSASQPLEIPLLRILYLVLYLIFKLDYLVCWCLVSWVLYIFCMSAMSDVYLVKIFSHSIGCHFVILTVSFSLEKLFSFMRSHLLIVDLSAWAISVLFRKLSYVLMHSRLSTTFSSMRFSVSCFYIDVFDPRGLEFCVGW